MMAWLLTLSYFLTNELRLYAGLFLFCCAGSIPAVSAFAYPLVGTIAARHLELNGP